MTQKRPVILKTTNVDKYFYEPTKTKVLDQINLEIYKGDFISITGKSGCGKTTLMYILSTMDTQFEGKLEIIGHDTRTKNNNQLADIRNEHLGFIFQFHYLLPDFSCLKNVMIPALKLAKKTVPEIEADAYDLLKKLNVEHAALKKASQISGGQQQRVAIARALINRPSIIMGDEPTGNLDSANSDNVFGLFRELSQEFHQTIVVVTHDKDFAKKADRTIEMIDGVITNINENH
ncbi:MAG: ABC transporter ATP-binding protein [Phycisphaerales bacterium]|nr:ABC transporter ATP-binding protein [Phycisphaerales bacterium]